MKTLINNKIPARVLTGIFINRYNNWKGEELFKNLKSEVQNGLRKNY